MVFKADLAGAAIGVAHLNVVGLYLRAKLTESVLVQLREGEATIASEATTANALGQEDIVRTEFGKRYHILVDAHLTS